MRRGRALGWLLLVTLALCGACKKRTVKELRREVLRLIKEKKLDEAAQEVARHDKLLASPLARARFYGEVGWTAEGLKAYGQHVAAGGAPERYVLESFLTQVWPLQVTRQWTRRDLALLARQAGFGEVETKFPGLLDSFAEARRGAYFAPWLHALGESRLVASHRFFGHVLDTYKLDLDTVEAFGEALGRFGDKGSLALLQRAVDKHSSLMGGGRLLRGIGQACETRMTADRRLGLLTVINRANERTNLRDNISIGAAQLSCRDRVTHRRLLEEARGGKLGVHESVDLHSGCVDPALQLEYCQAIAKSGKIHFKGFKLRALEAETKALDACLWKMFLIDGGKTGEFDDCDVETLWSIRAVPSAMKERLAAGAKHKDPDVRKAYVPMAFAHGLVNDREALAKLYKVPEGGMPSCHGRAWAALVVNPTSRNLAALDGAIKKADFLLGHSIIEAIADAPTPATVRLLLRNMERIKEWGAHESMDRLLRRLVDRGDSKAEALATELATSENHMMQHVGLKWLTRSQSKKVTDIAVRHLGSDNGITQTLGAIVLWAQAVRGGKAGKAPK